MSKLGPLFIPMGICTILFGFFYGEVFLVENVFPALLFRPLNNISEMMKVALGIAVVEMVLGLTVSMINKFKQRSPLDAFGEHGLGTILFLIGLFFAGLHFLEVGDIFQIFSYWAFLVMLSGLVLATSIPVVSAIMRKRVGVETLGEAVGALLMTFIESLANFFSFLRIAAFVLAHASLALAAHSLSTVLGSGGLIITNIVAMTFELMSVSVQSLRLLYYEFMGKFFQGEGSPFRPFVITAPRQIQELQA
jgi:V/A-type H+-transporting ATPase subunit I